MKDSGGGGEFMIHCKNISKCHNVPPPIITIKGTNSKKLFGNLKNEYM
jgi:hypothetical protein